MTPVATTLLKAFVIGFSIAAPVGPIGVLCIRRTLLLGRRVGFVSGLGAATADAFYGAVAAFGLTLVSQFFVRHAAPLHIVGGLFLLYLGARTAFAKTDQHTPTVPAPTDSGALRAYGSTLLLTITNPMTIVMFAAVFAAIAPAGGLRYAYAALTVVGVFFGSATWWFILSAGVGMFRLLIGIRLIQWVNRLSGATIFGFGVADLAERV
jgi:threonine/homoserine/homoserine lactone efflux protein